MSAFKMQSIYNLNRIFIFILILFFIFFSPADVKKHEFPIYRVVLDPGHGGFSLYPKIKHGDRYDSISKTYLSYYAAGTAYGNIEEQELTCSIASKVKEILDLTLQDSSFVKFSEIVKNITGETPERIIIRANLSREKSVDIETIKSDDPNADYRLYDFVDNKGSEIPGRISIINSFKPQLVVSLHCDYQAPLFFRGINPVIAAPYSLLHTGLNYLKGVEKKRDYFFKSSYADWFTESVRRTGYKWFLKDVSAYFTGFSVSNKLKVKDDFSGYIYNMVSWRYKDGTGWENIAKDHPQNTQYADNPGDFIPKGKFWEREQSKYESFRREGGTEGFGGDNLYASSEIIRYILLSFKNSDSLYPGQKLGKPYISVWSLPILVNAVSAYIELGYLKNRRDRYVLVNKQEEIAEGIATGIYSLFAGIKMKNVHFENLPYGKRIDLEKYKLPSGKSYFDMVVP